LRDVSDTVALTEASIAERITEKKEVPQAD
jgi:hypothetical protein